MAGACTKPTSSSLSNLASILAGVSRESPETGLFPVYPLSQASDSERGLTTQSQAEWRAELRLTRAVPDVGEHPTNYKVCRAYGPGATFVPR